VTNILKFHIQFPKFSQDYETSFSAGIHVIFGESGVGKSTFFQKLCGMDTDAGNFELKIHEKPTRTIPVFQNPENQIVSSTLDGELAFSPECVFSDPSQVAYLVDGIKDTLNFIEDGTRHPVTLSGGEKELLNLATALSVKPGLIVIDDGLSFLNSKAKKIQVKSLSDYTKDTGSIIIWLTSDISDLKFGDTVWELTLNSFTEINKSIPMPNYQQNNHPAGKLHLIADHLTYFYDHKRIIINDLSIEYLETRCFGIIGANGSGKTTIAGIISGMLPDYLGEFQIDIDGELPTIGYLNQFPEKMLGTVTLGEFILDLQHFGKLNPLVVNQALNMMNEYQINWSIIEHQPAVDVQWTALRLAMIILLGCSNYELIILDEPTFGLGWRQKQTLARFINKILNKKHCIIISHDEQFIHSICDKVLELDSKSLIQNSGLVREKR
jgi:energy-coupling factor transporter ATP-binding protein EcfA2